MTRTTFFRQAQDGITANSKGGAFRVRDTPGQINRIFTSFRPVAEKLDFWTLNQTVDVLRSQPSFKEVRSKMGRTRVTLEIAGRVAQGELQEAAVILSTEAGCGIAASRWVRGEGMFVENLLSDIPEPVEKVLAPIEARFLQAQR